MPNENWETTTLRLLKRTLYKHEFKSSEIEQYKAKKDNEIKKNGFFQAKFEVEGKIFYSQINFDFEKLITHHHYPIKALINFFNYLKR